MLIFCKSKSTIDHLKSELSQKLEITDLGPIAYYLGIEITRNRQNRTLSMSQNAYLDTILAGFGKSKLKLAKTPSKSG